MNLFRGHRKAVSYVKYVNEHEVLSASTDSNLRLWDVNSGQCLARLHGHHNEKNFVGLSTDGHHVVCGSENNRFYLYYKRISEPLMSFDFGTRQVDSCPGGGLEEGSWLLGSGVGSDMSESTETSLSQPGSQQGSTSPSTASHDFVSAVCWKKASWAGMIDTHSSGEFRTPT